MQAQNEENVNRLVLEIISQITKRNAQTIQLNHVLVDDLGLDSIQFLEMLAELEDKFGFELEVDDLRPELFRTVSAVIEFVKGQVVAQ
ncbi:acyl carrier protein [Paenibacillus oryzisoli]|uniref:acyl carrier protein n=1 Tax=Paenibacillus oryzisoli TaxID=1850517 RepID=UPI003D2BDADB